MKKLIIIMLFITGCAPQIIKPPVIYTDAIYYGDSLCSPNSRIMKSVDYAQVSSDCWPGRKLEYLSVLPNDKELIYLALGTNDVLEQTDVEDYGNLLDVLIASTATPVVCVLPNPINGFDSEPYREKMLQSCADTIDPMPDCGVIVTDPDGIHYGESDHQSMGICITEKLVEYGII